MQTLVLFVVLVIWVIYIQYYFYKVGESFLNAIAANEEREYHGYWEEVGKINPIMLIGIFPFPFITETEFNENANQYLKKRTNYLVKCYMSFIGCLFFSYVFRGYMN